MGDQRSSSTEEHQSEDLQQLLQVNSSAAAGSCGDKHSSTTNEQTNTGTAQPQATARVWHKKSLKTCVNHACSVVWSNGALCMSISSAVFSVSALLVKLTHDRIPTFQIVACRSSLSFLACAFGAHQAGIRPLFGKRQNYGFLLGRGICGAAAMTTYYLSIAVLPLADAVTLFFLNPAVTALAAWLLLKEPLGVVGGAGCLLSSIGLVLVAKPPFLFAADSQDWDHQRLLGTGFGLISALFAAGAFIFIRLVGKGEQALCMSVWFHVCAFTTSVLPLAAGLPEWPVLPSLLDAAILVGIAATSFWGQILIGRGFQLLTAARASAINFTQVVYSYLFGMALLGESLSLLGLAGSVLIAAGVIMVNLRQQPKPAAASNAGEVKDARAADQEQGRALQLSNSTYVVSSTDSHSEKQPLLQQVLSGASDREHEQHVAAPPAQAVPSVCNTTQLVESDPEIPGSVPGTFYSAGQGFEQPQGTLVNLPLQHTTPAAAAGKDSAPAQGSLYSIDEAGHEQTSTSHFLPPSPFSLHVPAALTQQRISYAQASPDANAASDGGWQRPLLAQLSGNNGQLQHGQSSWGSAPEQQSSGMHSPQDAPTSWRTLARLMGHLDSRVAVHAPDLNTQGTAANSSSSS